MPSQRQALSHPDAVIPPLLAPALPPPETVRDYCAMTQITFTRCRPYRKNDQAFVEQKNGAVVRRLVGYRRFEGLEAARVLAELYASSRLFVNFFQPSFKLAEKHRDGAKVHKRYHPPATPYQRLLDEAIRRLILVVALYQSPVRRAKTLADLSKNGDTGPRDGVLVDDTTNIFGLKSAAIGGY